MKEDVEKTVSRRTFVGAAASTALAVNIVPGSVMGKDAPSNKLNIAAIGPGHQGWSNLRNMLDENIVAMAEVDLVRGTAPMRHLPKAKVYRDFRVMFDEMADDIDAVVVATPDHTHYVAAMAAIERGKHVYCEKPLAHSVYEVRKLTEAARKAGVMTQMGNQGHSSEHIRLCREWVQSGAIGEVREVHAWSNRPMGGYLFPSGLPRPKDTPRVPDTMDWDLWLGPVKQRPYHPIYAPIYWRGWLDFGTGALGDMGCHILDPAFWALDLGNPVSVEANVSYNPTPDIWRHCLGNNLPPKEEVPKYLESLRRETYPSASIIRYEFPARGDMPPVNLTWYDGGMLPPRPEGMTKGHGGNGAFIIGDRGVIKHGSHGAGGCRIIPEEKMQAYMANPAPKTIKRVESHHKDWLTACKGGEPSSANWNYGGPLTEMVLLGVIALRVPEEKLLWDPEKMEFKNSKEANEFVKPEYREGWTL